jgi:hypothetical protein
LPTKIVYMAVVQRGASRARTRPDDHSFYGYKNHIGIDRTSMPGRAAAA